MSPSVLLFLSSTFSSESSSFSVAPQEQWTLGRVYHQWILPVCACVNVYVRAHASRACVARVCNAQRDRVAFPSHLFSSFFFHCIYASNKMKSWHIEYAVNPRLVHVQQWSETATCRVHASTLTAICLESLVSFPISFFFLFLCNFSLLT